MADQPQILVIRGGAIGDFILTLPAIQLLRENIPHGRLEILGYRPVIELAQEAGLAEGLRSLEHRNMAPLFVPQAVLSEELIAYFRGFKLIVSYLYDPDGYLKGNMERMGVKTYLEASHRVQPGLGHAAEQLAQPLEKLAFFLDDPAPHLKLSPSPEVTQPTIAFHPGSGSLRKNWSLQRWTEFFRQVMPAHSGIQVAVITGEAEAERGITEALRREWAEAPYSWTLWDQLPLTELAHRLTACRAFLGHDSGISHLAAACDVPCLLLFGPTDPAIWAPRNAGVQVVTAPQGNLDFLPLTPVLAAGAAFLANTLRKTA